jgi:hypothetical protein
MVVTGALVYGILMFERFGFRPVELIIGNLVAVMGLCYLIELFIAPVDWAAAALHTVTPQLADAEALLLAVAIIGATVEQAFAKIKHRMGAAQKRTVEDAWRHIGTLAASIGPRECANYFANAGYASVKM